MNISLPFGKKALTLHVDDKHECHVLTSGIHDCRPTESAEQLVQRALENPIGTPRLSEMAKGKNKITLISSDHTRPVPSHIITPLLLREIRRGNPKAEITILVATGLHRSTTEEELRAKYGDEIADREHIVIHDCDDRENLVSLGALPSGGELIVNRLAIETDLLVSEGFIEPHFFAGFSGGRKSVLPGVAARETVTYNHNSGFIASEKARAGILDGNPIHTDMLYAARAARLDFILNVVIDAAHDPIYAVAGDCDLAHRKGADFLLSHCRVRAIPADIAISTNGGYPLDQNIYQAVKGMTAAEANVKEGGVIIMAASASDGHGGESFYKTFKQATDLSSLMQSFLSRPATETIVDQWESQILTRILLRAKVIFVSRCPDELIRDMHMIPAHDMDEAMAIAEKLIGKQDYSVTVTPDGVSVVVTQ